MDDRPSRDLSRTTLAVLAIGGLILTSYLILRPFLSPLCWATLIAVAVWPWLGALQARCGGRRGLAVTGIMAALLLVFLVPVGLLLAVLVRGAPRAAAWVNHVLEEGVPLPPAWVADLPLVGDGLAERWAALAAKGPEGIAAQLRPHLEKVAGWLVTEVGGAGVVVLEFGLTLLFVGLLLARGEQVGAVLHRFARRLSGARGEHAVTVAAQSIRAVALGVLVTALAQALLGGLGLWIAGVPAAGLLTALMLFTGIAQLGAAPVVALAAIWLFVQGSVGWGIATLCWAVVVGSLDNVLRPLLIRRGVDLPLLLVFAGVVGGLIAFGFVGLFAGPVVLAVAYTLLRAWVEEEDTTGAAPIELTR